MYRFFLSAICVAVIVLLVGCDENTALMERVLDEDAQAAQEVLDSGAAVDERNAYGWTALMHAARIGNKELVTFLVKSGADVNAQDDSGRSALTKAAFAGHVDVVSALLADGADPNLADNVTGRTALHWAAARTRVEVAKVLLDAGADYTHKTLDGWTAMMIALDEGDPKMIEVFERAGIRR